MKGNNQNVIEEIWSRNRKLWQWQCGWGSGMYLRKTEGSEREAGRGEMDGGWQQLLDGFWFSGIEASVGEEEASIWIETNGKGGGEWKGAASWDWCLV